MEALSNFGIGDPGYQGEMNVAQVYLQRARLTLKSKLRSKYDLLSQIQHSHGCFQAYGVAVAIEVKVPMLCRLAFCRAGNVNATAPLTRKQALAELARSSISGGDEGGGGWRSRLLAEAGLSQLRHAGGHRPAHLVSAVP